MEVKMRLKVEYKCATCGLSHVEEMAEDVKIIEEKTFWHICADRNTVKLQSYVVEYKDEPVKKTSHK